jgi:hypothetical protein
MDSKELSACRVVVVSISEDTRLVEPVPFSAQAARNPNPVGVDQWGSSLSTFKPPSPLDFALVILVKSFADHHHMQIKGDLI